MYDFQKNLDSDEKILYQGQPVPGKGYRNVGGFIFVIAFALFLQVALILSVKYKIGDGADGIDSTFIIIFLTTLLFDLIALYGLFYNLILKKKVVADDFYCITNKRAFKYEARKNKLVYGNLINYDYMKCDNIKDNYGDFYLQTSILKPNDDPLHCLKKIIENILNQDPENISHISFESIKNPRQVKKITQDARKELLNAKK